MSAVKVTVVLVNYELDGQSFRANQYGHWFKQDHDAPEGWVEVPAHKVPLAIRRAWGSD